MLQAVNPSSGCRFLVHIAACLLHTRILSRVDTESHLNCMLHCFTSVEKVWHEIKLKLENKNS
jgi:hypothetical protein